MDWLGNSVGESISNPINVVATPTVMDDIEKHGTRYGSAIKYYKSKQLIKTQATRSISVNGITINMIPVDETEHVTIFNVMSKGKKIIYAPCDCKPFPKESELYEADILIIGNTIVGDVLKDEFVLKDDNPLRDELFTMEEIVKIKEEFNIKKVIVTHLEEDWGKSFDEYKKIEKNYDDIYFAYDGMVEVL